MLVSQRRQLVECYTRTEGGTWLLTSVREPEQTVSLTALGIELAVAGIYEDVETGPEEGPALLRLPD